MLFFVILIILTLSVTALLGYVALGFTIVERIWDEGVYGSSLYGFLGMVVFVFWICIPISFIFYISAVSSAG